MSSSMFGGDEPDSPRARLVDEHPLAAEVFAPAAVTAKNTSSSHHRATAAAVRDEQEGDEDSDESDGAGAAAVPRRGHAATEDDSTFSDTTASSPLTPHQKPAAAVQPGIGRAPRRAGSTTTNPLAGPAPVAYRPSPATGEGAGGAPGSVTSTSAASRPSPVGPWAGTSHIAPGEVPLLSDAGGDECMTTTTSTEDAARGRQSASGGERGGVDTTTMDAPSRPFESMEVENDDAAAGGRYVGPGGSPLVTDSDGTGGTTDFGGGGRDLPARGATLAHRRVVPTTSLWRAMVHIFKSNVGLGLFVLPEMYHQAGWVLSPIVGFLIGFTAIDCTLMLLTCRIKIAHARVTSYSDVAEFVYGSLARVVVNVLVIFVQLGLCLIYIQVAGGVVAEIVEFQGSYRTFVTISVVIVTPLMFLSNNFSLLAVSSITAAVLVIFLVCVTFEHYLEMLFTTGVSTTLVPFGVPAKWGIFLAYHMTVFEGVCVVIPVFNSVTENEKPKIPTAISRTLSAVVLFYFVYGTVGYLAFGSSLHSEAVSALPLGPLGDVARIALALNVLLTFPVQFVPAIQVIDKALDVDSDRIRQSKKGIATRIGIALAMVIAAIVMGNDVAGIVLGFIGSTAATTLTLTLPALLRLQLDYALENPMEPRKGADYYRHIFHWAPIPVVHFRPIDADDDEDARASAAAAGEGRNNSAVAIAASSSSVTEEEGGRRRGEGAAAPLKGGCAAGCGDTLAGWWLRLRCYVYVVLGIVISVVGLVFTIIDAAEIRRAVKQRTQGGRG